MFSRITPLTCVLLAVLPFSGCSDSSNPDQSGASSAGSKTAPATPSWAVESGQSRPQAITPAPQNNSDPAFLTGTNPDDKEFAALWEDLEASQRQHLIFVNSKKVDALRRLDAFIERYPDSVHRERALYIAALGQWSGYNFKAAAPRYQAYLAEYPREARSHLARVRHAQSLLRSDQPELAVQVVDAYAKYPVAHQRELVKAEALAAMGKQDEAASLMRSWLTDPDNQALDPRTQDEGRRLLEKIERINALAPEFETFTYDGEPISMDQFKGKVLLVDFWKSTCNPCMSELPQIADLYDTYRNDGFEVFAVNMDTDSGKMEDAIEVIGADWPVYHDGMAFNGEIARLFDVYRTPTTILIDRDGKVRAFDQRFESIKAMVPKLLKESASN
ncbi:MAG: redoxin domain-containing protein [Planctomycetota bacterium]|nr:redoxin domain-containing protein [Planctomycetota bacterium]MED5507297.1 redoxin domain-containing protein [Planctomycetota bacterium]